jgi:lipopolysaccharide biosynthesis protein
MICSNKNPLKRIRQFASHLVTLFWWHLPIKRESRKRIKDVVFGNFGFLFRSTLMYRSWQELNLLENIVTTDNGVDYPEHWPKLIEHKTLISSSNALAIQNIQSITSLAIIIHAFYGDILQEMLENIGNQGIEGYKLFVTCPNEKVDEIQLVLKNCSINYDLIPTENRGRDVLPFIRISQMAIDQGFNLILKLHTKKSDHRMTGSLWRKEIFKCLLPHKEREKIIGIFNINHNIGLLGPAGHIVPMSLYYGINAKAIGYLCRQIGVDTQELQSMNFVAGSMFFVRSDALLPLLKLNMPDTAFEPEAGQRDGTMAHAYERAFAVSNFAAGFKLVDTNFDPSKPNPQVIIDHPFTW